MTELSLRDYLKKKGAIPNHGVRWCAPSLSLTTISLRSLLLGIERLVLHLSDLHIGLNCKDGAVPQEQTQKIIDAIKIEYAGLSRKPIVVITGDVVDHANHQDHVNVAYGLLDQIASDGFTVLVVPGNHDYSDTFSTDCFTPLEGIPVVGTEIMIAARVANFYKGKGQDETLISGMTFSSEAAEYFKEKMNPFLGLSGHYVDSLKGEGAVFDLDFILLDGQDREAHRPDWDDPRRFVREKVRDVVLAFEHCPPGVDKNTLADMIGNAVANLALDPATIYGATFTTVITIEESAYETAYGLAFAALSLAATVDPAAATTVASLLIAAHPIFELLDLGLAATVASVAATAVTVPLLDDKFFLHDGDFRLAHGYLDAPGLESFKDRVENDLLTQTVPIACIHYWLNCPHMDTTGDDMGTLKNEKDLLEVLSKCHLLLVGHIHEQKYQTSSMQGTVPYYSCAGSTVPIPHAFNNENTLERHRTWVELSINLNTRIVIHKQKP